MGALSDLCWAYRALLVARAGQPDLVEVLYSAGTYGAMIAELPRLHARPSGDILVADLDGAIVGCAMYYPINDTTCEIKRVYVTDAARGHGVGRTLMQTGMERARADGYDRMVLDTIVGLTEAITLYGRLGFAPADPFYDLKPGVAPYIRFFDIAL
jgi:GNAT superfamily N-acetyltransferase